jgi:hypothetical protein
MRPGSPHAIESLRSQTGDPVCQLLAVLLAKIRDCGQRLGTAPQFGAGGAADVRGQWARHRAGSGPGAFIKGLSAGCRTVIAA